MWNYLISSIMYLKSKVLNENSILWLTFSSLENIAAIPLHGRMQSVLMEGLHYNIVCLDSKFYQDYYE